MGASVAVAFAGVYAVAAVVASAFASNKGEFSGAVKAHAASNGCTRTAYTGDAGGVVTE